jgi:ABC-type protease/lipase transport system fused ATPase/permease subunit
MVMAKGRQQQFRPKEQILARFTAQTNPAVMPQTNPASRPLESRQPA